MRLRATWEGGETEGRDRKGESAREEEAGRAASRMIGAGGGAPES